MNKPEKPKNWWVNGIYCGDWYPTSIGWRYVPEMSEAEIEKLRNLVQSDTTRLDAFKMLLKKDAEIERLLDSNTGLRDKNKRLRRLLERVLEAIGSSPPPILEIERELGDE